MYLYTSSPVSRCTWWKYPSASLPCLKAMYACLCYRLTWGSSFSMAVCLSTPSTTFVEHSLTCSVPRCVSGQLFPAWSLCCCWNSHSTTAGPFSSSCCYNPTIKLTNFTLSSIAAFPFRVSNTALLRQWRSPGDTRDFDEVFLCKNASPTQGPEEFGRESLCFWSYEFPSGHFSLAGSQAMPIHR